jgi:hypothetical protein
MSVPVREPNDRPSKDGSLNYAPNKARHPEADQSPADTPRKVDSASQRGSREPPPWRGSKQSDPFAGDVAIAELRNRLAPDRLPEPLSVSAGSKFSLAVRLAGVAAVAAAGVVGYRLGLAPPASPEQINRSNQEDLASERSVSTGYLETPSHDSRPAFRSAPGGVSTGLTVDHGGGVRNSQLRRLADSEIELMVKRGAEYMANGNVGAARMILQPAAQAGDPVAAFALAETYDPLVLGKLNAKGGIAADISLAQTWYEKAKDLGSAVAPERLARLARLPE